MSLLYSWKARRWHRRRARALRKQKRDLERAASRGVKLIPERDLRWAPMSSDRAVNVGRRPRVPDRVTIEPVTLDAEELARRLGLRCPECGRSVETRSVTSPPLRNVEYTTLRGYGSSDLGLLIYAECWRHGMVTRSVTREHLKAITGRAA